MTQVRIGIIGAGQISESCTTAVRKHAHADVVAAHDPNADRLRALCEKFAIPRAYARVDDLLADPEVDAVYIAVPNRFHAPLSRQALEAGKHVVLDKPFALNLAEAEGVAAAARKAGKLFLLGMNQRYREDSQKIRSLVEAGVLGEIYHAKAYWFRRSGIPKLGTWFGSKAMAGGGCLLDIGVHLLDLCLHTAGKWDPVSVSGATYTKFGNRGMGEGGWGRSDREDLAFDVDDFASALIRFADGSTVTLDVSWAAHMPEGDRMDVRLYGTEAGAGLYPARLFRNDPMREDYDVVEKPRAAVPLPHADRFHNFINAIRGEEKLLVSLEQALCVQRILDAIYASARDGAEVRLDRRPVAG